MSVQATPLPDVAQALQLISEYQQMLLESGYRRCRVDTWASPDNTITVRFGYAGSEWRLHVLTQSLRDPVTGRARIFVVKFDLHHPLPTIDQVLDATVLREIPYSDADLDANRETTIRGGE